MMKKPFVTGRIAALAFALISLAAPALHAQGEEPRLVFLNGRSAPLNTVAVEGGKFVIKTASDNIPANTSYPLTAASHISGERPAAIDKGVALILLDDYAEAVKLLEPVVTSQKASATVPGNHWLPAARATLLLYSLYNEPGKAETLGKEISDATPESGPDPVVLLGQALALPLTVKFDERVKKLDEMVSDTNPVEVSAYASYFKGKLLKKIAEAKRQEEALTAFLTVGCLYPAGGLVVVSAAEMQAAELIKIKPERKKEALSLIESAVRGGKGTAVGTAAQKALDGLK